MDDALDEWNYGILKHKMEQSDAAGAPKQKLCSFIPSSSCLCFKKVATLLVWICVNHDSQAQNCYPLRVWICVSDPFDLADIAKGIVERVQGSCQDGNQMDTLLERAKESISGKKFLLVLDDVWTENFRDWEPLKICLKFGGVGGKISVTTRKDKVARVMGTTENGIHRIGLLSKEDCWLLLSHVAFIEKSEHECKKFKGIGWELAKKCKGLALAAKTLGSLLCFKTSLEEWKNVLDSEIWELEEVEVDLFPYLLLSYNELFPTLKRCFSYCAIFPKDHVIRVEDLINSWLALGYLGSNGSAGELEIKGRKYFDNLAMRSLFQDLKKDDFNEYVVEGCKMHDIVHDFARFLRKKTSNGSVEATCQVCSPSLVYGVKEYRSLFCYEEPPPHLCDCLLILRVLSLRKCGLRTIPREIIKFIHLRFLNLSYVQIPSTVVVAASGKTTMLGRD